MKELKKIIAEAAALTAAANTAEAAAEAAAVAETAAEAAAEFAAEAAASHYGCLKAAAAKKATKAAKAAQTAAEAAGNVYRANRKNERISLDYSNALDFAEAAEEKAEEAEENALITLVSEALTEATKAARAADKAEKMAAYADGLTDRLATAWAKREAAEAAEIAGTAADEVREIESSYRLYTEWKSVCFVGYEFRKKLIEAALTAAEAAAEAAAISAHDAANFAEAAAEAAAISAHDAANFAEAAAEAAADETEEAEEAEEKRLEWEYPWSVSEAAVVGGIAESAWLEFRKRAAGTERERIALDLLKIYEKTTKARIHIAVFEYNNEIRYVYSDSPIVTTAKKGSREKDGLALRFCPNQELKKTLFPLSHFLCTSADFARAAVTYGKENRGDLAEILYKVSRGYEPKKDDSPFWVACDVMPENASVKFENGTIIHEQNAAAALKYYEEHLTT